MSDRLDGPRAKIERAKDHLSDLQAEVTQFLSRDPYGVIDEYDPETGENMVRARVSESPPPRIAAIVGDLAHNLRSAWDYLARQLVLANHGTPRSGTEFPIFWDPEAYKTGFGRKVRGMSKDAVGLIDRIQPHLFPDPTLHPLYAIHHLDIEDKHHDWLIVGCAVHSMAIGKGGGTIHFESLEIGGPQLFAPLIDGAELWRYKLGPRTDMNVNSEVAFTVAFDQAGVGKGQAVLPVCEHLINVCERAIEDFRPFL
ncbi:MAG: hypothetical protein ACHQ01_07670 [Candidatus Limnocylindrales bacterium]